MTIVPSGKLEDAPSAVPAETQAAAAVWDGMSVDVPATWEPARLGLGYILFEDATGPRLTLRWQSLKSPAAPEKVLRRLSRRKQLMLSDKPQGAVAAMLSALPGECGALPCADVTGRGADAVLFALQGGTMAVLAAPHAREGEKAGPWAVAAKTLSAADPGAFSLFDVSGVAPAGFRLAAFSVQLGHFHFQFRQGGETLDYYRFAPAEVILRAKSLEGWAGEVFAQALDKARVFAPGYLGGSPAASFQDGPGASFASAARAAASRVFDRARFARAMAWRPDASRIFAAIARHRGGLSETRFEEVCTRYAVRTP